jgi:putative endonuclease
MYVYIVTNRKYGRLYIGVTNNLARRVWEHKNKILKGFTAKYNLDKLVYYETYEDEITAIAREKTLKNYHRDWKFNLIETMNKEWNDLYDSIS